MKVAICGSGVGGNKDISEKAKELGKAIADNKGVLLTGGCDGYPYSAVRGALLADGKVICYSPASSKEEHVSKYGFPFEEEVDYVFTGKGIPGRNLDLVSNSDAVVFLDGRIGTLNEFTIAFVLGKKIGVLDSGELIGIVKEVAGLCDKSREVVYEKDVVKLVKKLMN